MAGFRIDVSASSCNLGIKDPKNWFSTSNICSTFHLTLSDPFHRAIAILLMHIVACHRSYKIGNCVWVREIDGKMESSKVDLVEKVVVDFASKRLSAPQLKQIEVLRKVKEAAENTQMALDLFNEVDEDGSGLIDEDELGQMMKNLGTYTCQCYCATTTTNTTTSTATTITTTTTTAITTTSTTITSTTTTTTTTTTTATTTTTTTTTITTTITTTGSLTMYVFMYVCTIVGMEVNEEKAKEVVVDYDMDQRKDTRLFIHLM